MKITQQSNHWKYKETEHIFLNVVIMDSVLKSYITRTLHQLQDVYAFLTLSKTFVNIWLAIS